VFLVKQLTIGQVLGIAVDVTFVRLLLVPSFMRLLGRLNWWAPAVLGRVGARRG
jgi:RND superfamily putative drug exporter